MMRRTLSLALEVVALSIVLAACGSTSSNSSATSSSSASAGSGGSSSSSGASAQAPRYGGSVVFATSAEPVCLDPSYEGDDSQDIIARQFLDDLVSVNKNGSYAPWLATSWTITDHGLTYTFHLRQDVKFTDGTPFNAAAVKANVAHWIAPGTESGNIGPALSNLAGVTVSSADTVIFHLKTPNSWLLMDLANPAAGIQSAVSLQRKQSAICQDPIGTGPFIVKQWIHGEEVSFTANGNYNSSPPQAAHTGKPYLTQLTWKFIPEGATRFGALAAGDVGIINGIPPESFKAATSSSQYTVLNAEVPGVPQQLDLNTTAPPLNNLDVRKAFLYSADVPAALKSAFFGSYQAPVGPLSPTTPFYDPAVANAYSYNIAEADKLLDAAGWTQRNSAGYRVKDGKQLTVVLPVYSVSQTGVQTETESLYQQLQATAKQAGFDLEIQNGDTSAVDADESDYHYNLFIDYWTVNTPVALSYVYNSVGIKAASAGAYHNDVSGIDSPEIDSLEQQGLDTTDLAKQRVVYDKLQSVISSLALSLQLYVYPLQLAQNNTKARGLRLDWAEPVPTLYDTWVPAG
jgi:peptide/nickel transport system substrate-binding protein